MAARPYGRARTGTEARRRGHTPASEMCIGERCARAEAAPSNTFLSRPARSSQPEAPPTRGPLLQGTRPPPRVRATATCPPGVGGTAITSAGCLPAARAVPQTTPSLRGRKGGWGSRLMCAG